MSFSFDNVTKSSLHMHTVCTFQNILTLCLKCTYGVHNVCNVCMPDAMGDVISSIGIGIGIGIAVSNSIGYRTPAWYRSNPNFCIILSPSYLKMHQ